MLILASASPRRRELLAQAGFGFEVRAANIPEEPEPGEDPIAYVTRLAREKAQAVFHQLTTPDAPEPGAPEPALSWSKGPSHLGTRESNQPQSAHHAQTPAVPPRIIVLGADTTVVLDNQILGKPSDAADAARMLRLLSGRTHRVITGVALVTAERTEVAAEVTAVRFLTLSDEEIAGYIATGEPMDKAGAYGIQGRAAKWIPRIEGDYFNVVGLPISLVSTILASL